MKVVVVGQGGREHALVRALNLSSSVSHVFAIPGSRGISQEAECISLPLFPSDQFLNFIKDKKIDLVVVGPEGPLAEGLADELRQRGILTVGPSAQAAQLEASKIFSKEFMKRAGVPSARYEVVRDMEQLEEKAQKFCPPYVLKADGLAAGKGVFICQNWDELREAGHSIFVEKKLGKAGHSALLEEALKGWELSFLVLTNGEELVPLPLS
ncbi:MAG: ATP-grasp domain-containing protein, partial [Bdellovibrionales bacterium]|nr:ATP-grasp domain-containing protein [Bdellovibrionales bacterium]